MLPLCKLEEQRKITSVFHPSLTCWNESSNSVCLDTEIFTWLGKALDCTLQKEKKNTTIKSRRKPRDISVIPILIPFYNSHVSAFKTGTVYRARHCLICTISLLMFLFLCVSGCWVWSTEDKKRQKVKNTMAHRHTYRDSYVYNSKCLKRRKLLYFAVHSFGEINLICMDSTAVGLIQNPDSTFKDF